MADDDSTTSKVETIAPNRTLYVNNINERVRKDELRKSLYAVFSQFGPILDVIAMKTYRMRGQAFIVFRDQAAATEAMRNLQSFPFYDKPLRIAYAKSKSDIVAKMDGTWKPDISKPREEARKKRREELKELRKRAPAESKEQAATKKAKTESSDASAAPKLPTPKPQPPNKILFVQNLPSEANKMMLSMLFQQYPGFQEARMVTGSEGIAFVEFENDMQAAVAMNQLQHFKVTPTHLMVISFAKK